MSATVYRSPPDEWERRSWDLAAVPGEDVLAMEVRHLASLPAPWRLRIQAGEHVIEACSVVLPGTWSAAELVYLLAGVLLARVTTDQVQKAAALRLRVTAVERWSWERVSGGLVGVEPAMVEGTVGSALERVGARLLGAWSGVDSGIEVQRGEAKEAGRPVRGVRKGVGSKGGAVSSVPGRKRHRSDV